MKKLIFVLLLIFIFPSFVYAEEEGYLNIGGNPRVRGGLNPKDMPSYMKAFICPRDIMITSYDKDGNKYTKKIRKNESLWGKLLKSEETEDYFIETYQVAFIGRCGNITEPTLVNIPVRIHKRTYVVEILQTKEVLIEIEKPIYITEVTEIVKTIFLTVTKTIIQKEYVYSRAYKDQPWSAELKHKPGRSKSSQTSLPALDWNPNFIFVDNSNNNENIGGSPSANATGGAANATGGNSTIDNNNINNNSNSNSNSQSQSQAQQTPNP